MEITTVPVYYVNMVLDSLEQQGWDRGALISRVNLSAELLDQERARIPRSDYLRFAGYLARKLQDESYGLMSRPMKPGTFAMLSHSCITCDTLGHFLSRTSKFVDIAVQSISLNLSQEGEYASYRLTPLPGEVYAPDHLAMLAMGIIHRVSSWAIGQKIVLHEVHIRRARPFYANDYNLLFSAPIRFGQEENCIRFHADYLEAQISQDEVALRKFLSGSAIQLMSELELDSSLTSRIRGLIKGHVGGQFPTFEQVADSLNYTTATLRRRLRAEGSTYHDIKDAIRRDTAIHLLSQRSMSVDEVSEHAGFSEPTSFFRAFKRWTGTSPRMYSSVNA